MKTCASPVCAALLFSALMGCAQAPVKPAMRVARSAPLAQAATIPAPARKADDVQARHAAALDLMRTQQWREAESAMLALTREAPALSGPWTNLGILRARRKDWNGAVLAFSSAVGANPRNLAALNWLGTSLRMVGDPARAEQAYLRALAVDADDARTHLNLAVLYDLSLKRPQQALEHYRASQQGADANSTIVQAWIRDLETPAQAGAVMVGSTP